MVTLEDQVTPKLKRRRRFIRRDKWIKIQNKLKAAPINAVYNYSKISLTEPMKKLLNRGLNFCVAPLKLNLAQTITEFNKFERSFLWKEWWAGRQDENFDPKKTKLFKKENTTLPPKGSREVRTFLTAIKSDILGSKFNKPHSNITKDETEALKSLILLQKNCQIVIKPCDKGAGIIICDYVEYATSCSNQLNSVASNGEKHYKEVPFDFILDTKKEIIILQNNWLLFRHQDPSNGS